MGLMDKFKNLFTDEEFEDDEEIEEPVKIKEVKKKEPKDNKDKLPTFMREKLEKEEKNKDKIEDTFSDFIINKSDIEHSVIDNNVKEKEPVKVSTDDSGESFKFPIDFDDTDFGEVSRVSRNSKNNKGHSSLTKHHESKIKKVKLEPKKEVKVAELYKDKRDDKKVDSKRFQATPIISPIYGVLNKNYLKDEITTANGDNYEINRPSKNIDFDSVRKKAYGESLVDDIKNNMVCENCDYYKKANSCKKKLDRDDLMYEALCERDENDNDITLDEAAENYYDYGVEYEKKQDIDSYIDEEYDDIEDVKIVNHDDDSIEEKHTSKKGGVPPVKSSINLLSTLKKSMGNEDDDLVEEDNKKEKNLELTDDLFNLIDSMYDEGKD